MSGVLDRLEVIRRSFRLPSLSFDVMTATEKAAASISSISAEPWQDFWRRVKSQNFATAPLKDQLRVIREGWSHPEAAGILPTALAFCRSSPMRSPKTVLIETYLREYPREHESFGELAETCEKIASEPDHPWHASGKDLDLWNPSRGPNGLADALSRSDEPRAGFIAAGFRGELHRGRFARQAVETFARSYGAIESARMEDAGRRLVALLRTDWFIELRGMIAIALLLPWRERRPSSALRTEITNALAHFGDPREKGPDWDALKNGAQAHFSAEEVAAGISVLSRWLGEASVRQFFSIIQRSTGNTQQWKSREQFWSSYLDADLIDAAWFALGPIAQRLVANSPDISAGKYAKLLKGSSSDEQSTLIMQIGNAIIAEWSDNGACRFWLDTDTSAPDLYKGRYLSTKLRTTFGGEAFAYIPHQGAWQAKFAQQIKKMTGISRPR